MIVTSHLGPLLFDPIYKEKVWGGRNLETYLSRDIPAGMTVGESWEISGFGSEWSTVSNAPLAGTSLRHLLESHSREVVGRESTEGDLPLLFKFIDANDKLSVQVHPDDGQARSNGWGNFGKTECWYIVAAKPGARIIVGLKEGVSLADVEEGVRRSALGELLNRIDVTQGDVLFVPAGTVHSILDGTVIYEVQESSDTTFRLYDWGRTEPDGMARPLHVAESLSVLDTHYHQRHRIPPVHLRTDAGSRRSIRVACGYFVLEEYRLEAGVRENLPANGSMQVIANLGGTMRIVTDTGSEVLGTGRTVLIPGCAAGLAVETDNGSHFLLSSVPDLAEEIVRPLRALGVADSSIAELGGNPSRNDLLPLLQ